MATDQNSELTVEQSTVFDASDVSERTKIVDTGGIALKTPLDSPQTMFKGVDPAIPAMFEDRNSQRVTSADKSTDSFSLFTRDRAVCVVETGAGSQTSSEETTFQPSQRNEASGSISSSIDTKNIFENSSFRGQRHINMGHVSHSAPCTLITPLQKIKGLLSSNLCC